jgi:hypothetical protein
MSCNNYSQGLAGERKMTMDEFSDNKLSAADQVNRDDQVVNNETVDRLGEKIDRYADNAHELAVESRQGRAIAEEVRNTQRDIRKTQKRQVWMSVLVLISVFLMIALGALVLKGQHAGQKRSVQIRQTADQIQSCTTPGGDCFERSNAVTGLFEDLVVLRVEDQRLTDVIQAAQTQGNDLSAQANQSIKDDLDAVIAQKQSQLKALTAP